MKKVYVSIPITGESYTDQQNHAFVVATNLAAKGYEVITPFDIASTEDKYNDAMGKCIAQLLECDAIFLCIGWNHSRGCRAELEVALVYGKGVLTEQ